MNVTTLPRSPLTDEIVESCGQRAADYDRENRFFAEDFEELRRCGYLLLAVPTDLGGRGLNLAEVGRELRRLASRAPATALATNMHLYWTGAAADLYRQGDRSLEWLLREAVDGEVFAAGHAEVGNDLPVLLSTSKAERVQGGYRITGRKMFGSLTPVWTRLGLHAMDASDPTNPMIVHAFMRRDDQGYEIKETWDTLGMRATRSDDTILNGVCISDRYVARVVPAGTMDDFVLGALAWGLLGFANVYYGLALRALSLAVDAIRKKTSLGLQRSMAYHPEIQHYVADMKLEIDGLGPHVDRVTEDWSDGVDHGPAWPAVIMSAKYHAVESAKRVVDLAMDVSGGAGMFKQNELERLYRDVRCGGFHPANSALTHEIVGKTTLGVDLHEQPRWG